MFGQIRAAAKRHGWGPSHLFFLILCYANERRGRIMHELFGLQRDRIPLGPIGVDPLRERDLMARILQAAERGQPLRVMGVTREILVQAKADPAFAAQVQAHDLLYCAEDAIRRKLWWSTRQRTHTVCLDAVMPELREEAERRGIAPDRILADPS